MSSREFHLSCKNLQTDWMPCAIDCREDTELLRIDSAPKGNRISLATSLNVFLLFLWTTIETSFQKDFALVADLVKIDVVRENE